MTMNKKKTRQKVDKFRLKFMKKKKTEKGNERIPVERHILFEINIFCLCAAHSIAPNYLWR